MFLQADHFRIVVGDLKFQVIDIETGGFLWILRLNKNVLTKTVGHAFSFQRLCLQQRDFLMDDDFTDDPRLSDSQAAAGKSVLYPN